LKKDTDLLHPIYMIYLSDHLGHKYYLLLVF